MGSQTRGLKPLRLESCAEKSPPELNHSIYAFGASLSSQGLQYILMFLGLQVSDISYSPVAVGKI